MVMTWVSARTWCSVKRLRKSSEAFSASGAVWYCSDDGAGQDVLGLARVDLGGVDEGCDAILRQRRGACEPVFHEAVGDGHGFAELFAGASETPT